MVTDIAALPHVIASGLGREFDSYLSRALPDLQIISLQPDHPWGVPPGTEIVLVLPTEAWKNAPRDRPKSWESITYVQSTSVGLDAFPEWVRSVPYVSCGRGLPSDLIAEYVLGAMLNFVKGYQRNRAQSASEWIRKSTGTLSGSTLGLAGFGSIAAAIVKRARPFDMKLIAIRRSSTSLPEDVEAARDLKDLASRCDHLVIALPLTAKTYQIFGEEVLFAAKPGMHLINVSRGAVLDLDALQRALEMGAVQQATLDVTDPEPLPEGHWAYSDPRILLTPHMSWLGSRDAQCQQKRLVIENVRRFLRGSKLLNEFNSKEGY